MIIVSGENLLDVKKIKNLSKNNWLSALEYANLVAAKAAQEKDAILVILIWYRIFFNQFSKKII